jgi:hypothetical protein
MEFELWGGPTSQINAVPLNSTAFGFRDALFTVFLLGASAERWDNSNIDLFDSFAGALTAHTPGPFYLYRNCEFLGTDSSLSI